MSTENSSCRTDPIADARPPYALRFWRCGHHMRPGTVTVTLTAPLRLLQLRATESIQVWQSENRCALHRFWQSENRCALHRNRVNRGRDRDWRALNYDLNPSLCSLSYVPRHRHGDRSPAKSLTNSHAGRAARPPLSHLSHITSLPAALHIRFQFRNTVSMP